MLVATTTLNSFFYENNPMDCFSLLQPKIMFLRKSNILFSYETFYETVRGS